LKTGNDLVTERCPNLAFSCLRYGTGKKGKACKMLLLQAFRFVCRLIGSDLAVWTEYELIPVIPYYSISYKEQLRCRLRFSENHFCPFLAAVGDRLSACNSGSKLQLFFEIQTILKNNYLR
jgi:hypothetical protein